MQNISLRELGHKLDLKNPKTLNEKINWLKLNGDTSLWARCSDKFLVREFLLERNLGHILTKLYGVYKSANEIDFRFLPKSFVLKANHDSGSTIIVKDKSKINIEDIKRRLDTAISMPYGTSLYEPQYLSIKPLIIAEELLSSQEDKSIDDYKIWCFDGKPYSILIVQNRTNDKIDLSTYDVNWNYINCMKETSHNKIAIKKLPKPDKLDEILEVAAKLSEGFKEVRVDLYYVNGKIYFGELTFTSWGGFMQYYKDEYQIELGTQINLDA